MKCSTFMNLFNIVVIVVVLGIVGVCHGDGLSKNFYKKSCPSAEQIVQNITWTNVASSPFLPAQLLRLAFHDCIVRVILRTISFFLIILFCFVICICTYWCLPRGPAASSLCYRKTPRGLSIHAFPSKILCIVVCDVFAVKEILSHIAWESNEWSLDIILRHLHSM